ncbi:hypothetical protein BC962_2745 [Gillisia mitskevichiae]|uniref:Alpha/beta hydrolase n=1 Tax=Gillisia mitskevichiae TaxID=270921 RepID=A0A495P5F7_9FLAO|nr:hypothetical protein [Gillisia mitskevichiae]RKS45070.1 hypothetical protein BC962_2745 [Gillisia mitskevichiae]
MKITLPIFIGLFTLLFYSQALNAQDISLRKGAVVDSLPINDSIPDSFAMYLPRDYTTDKSWPIVFVFDNEGRGINTARLFSSATEEQGYLVVASNNISKEDSLLTNLETASRLVKKILLNFPIDENRVFTAGLGEGALVSSALPVLYPKIKGILVVEDVWINKDFLAQDNIKRTVVGFAGYKSDYSKFNESFDMFKIFNHKSMIYNYEDESSWPSVKLISHGIGSFTLQSMLEGNQPKDEQIINMLFEQELETAESMRRQLNFYKAYELLELMREKYKYFDKKDEIRDLQKEIRRESIYKEQRSQYNSAKIKEQNLRYEYPLLLEDDLISKSFENVGWWVQQYKEIDSLKSSNVVAEVELGYRLEDYLQTYTKERFTELKSVKAGIDKLILISILRTVFDKENPEGYFSIISLSAQDGDYYTAMLYLEDLLKTGYKNLEELYNIPGTLDLKLSPEFNELIKKYLGESKYYNLPFEN